ncbi:trehalose-phosphatase [Corynebacterium pacaense]|uniref:trehalose-phosphatase n=1 Tax=Corynebacterium pacaense TaxID=1816684 RepID=UPI0009BB1373|nr:trehalose-phosphatase [Corynebacterium pacaense]
MTETPSTPSILELAETNKLLVVSDFDGTIAGFSKDPYLVPINQKSLKAVKDLSRMPNTDVVILSGRHLAGLARVLDLGDYPITIVGSHGSEDSSRPRSLSQRDQQRLERIEADLNSITDGHDGAFVEVKPYHRVLHFIRVSDPEAVAGIIARAEEIDASGLHVTRGKNIIEYSVSTTTKGSWLAAAVNRIQPSGIIFIGDDTTDEDGFRTLVDAPGALTVKVGTGDTAAMTRVPDIEAVGSLLEKLAYHRMQHTEAKSLNH